MNSLCNILINDLRIWIHLGCGEAEKENAQLVSFNIELIFKTPPGSLITDNLDDTVCYLKLTQAIQNLCKERRFNLIEHLAHEVSQTLVTLLTGKNIAELKIAVHKLAPPVPGVHGGVIFTYASKIT